ncbi:hypothetical protein ABW20_dc0108077 [Dactylellina cionopaga]|nr:hypothetical protein ABW20_dc0108077 [Dactylellina cionopaga]
MDPPRRREVNKSETYKKWVKLHLADIIASLVSYPEYASELTYFFNGHPIRWVYIVGTVIAIDVQEKKAVYTIDDGSGQTLNAVVMKKELETLKNVPQLHSTVKVKGQLELVHGAWQMKLLELETNLSFDSQVRFWKEANETHDRLAKKAKKPKN